MSRVAFAALLAACSSSGDGGAADQLDGGNTDATIATPEPGLRGEYFARYHERVVERVDPAIDFAWGDGELAPGAGSDRVSARWTGFLEVPIAGSYTFVTSNDDGVRVRIGDTLVIDDWNFHFPERHEGTVELAAGSVPIVVEYFEIDLTAEMRLWWSSPSTGLAEEIIPTERLTAAPPPADAIAVKPPYVNPVIDRDCPDPGVTFAGDAFYMVCTGGSFPIRRSPDLVMWQATGTAVIPGGKAPWSANGGRNWAPEIHKVGTKYVAYFTAVNSANVLSIGAASADSVEGPYTDRGGPLVEHPQGVIDASFFRDTDGTPYLTYKIDGNSVGQPTPIYIRKLAPNGLSFAAGSAPVEILRNAPATWEGGVVEAQWIVERDGTYYVFYSGNVYDHRYRTGVARATSITGPYTKRGAPILTNNARWVGPGHGSVVTIGDAMHFVYHAWVANADGTNGPGGRRVLVDQITWGADGWPKIANGSPSTTKQVWPVE
jgi:GH43 family beta-xylosidase